ncbi:MAG: hypothetical protein FWF63_07285 [Fibromonadales bacterium]|nr:hypothetical protein [Fibromonadales bacterium]
MNKNQLISVKDKWQVMLTGNLKPLVQELCRVPKVRHNMSQIISLAVLEKYEREIGRSV